MVHPWQVHFVHRVVDNDIVCWSHINGQPQRVAELWCHAVATLQGDDVVQSRCGEGDIERRICGTLQCSVDIPASFDVAGRQDFEMVGRIARRNGIAPGMRVVIVDDRVVACCTTCGCECFCWVTGIV